MPNTLTPHEAYIAAVACACDTAGVAVTSYCADVNDPLDGFIEFAPTRALGCFAGYDEVSLCWSEDKGWWILTVDDPHGRDSRNVYDLHAGILPSPETVVHEFADRACLTLDIPGDTYPDLTFEDYTVEDDAPEFDAALAAYGREEPE